MISKMSIWVMAFIGLVLVISLKSVALDYDNYSAPARVVVSSFYFLLCINTVYILIIATCSLVVKIKERKRRFYG